MIQDPVEIRHLRYFLAVAGAGSFSRAADRLGISQPSVSQQMRDLETALRVSLFQRRGKRILLTAAGLIFQERARAILRQLENFLDELSRDSTELRGALHLGIVPWLDVALVPQLLGLFASPSRRSPRMILRRRWKKVDWTWGWDFSPIIRRTYVTNGFPAMNMP